MANHGVATGRASVFRNKKGGDRVQGTLTRRGSQRFAQARGALALMTERPVTTISDADVIEYLARGAKNTRAYLAGESL
jgi:hypothetical protein